MFFSMLRGRLRHSSYVFHAREEVQRARLMGYLHSLR